MIKINSALINPIIEKAARTDRRRTNFNFHKEYSDTLQRMLNIMNRNTYIQPHKHESPDKREAFIVLKGKALVIEFDDKGEIVEHIVLDPQIGNHGCDIAERTWHTIICLEDNSVFYEVKDGPYEPADDKNFASWAPKEGDESCLEYNKHLVQKLGIEL